MRRLIFVVLLAVSPRPAGALDLIEAHRAAVEHDADFAAQLSAADARPRIRGAEPRLHVAARQSSRGQAGRRDRKCAQSGDLSSLLSSEHRRQRVRLRREHHAARCIGRTRWPTRAAWRRRARSRHSHSRAEQDLILRVAQTYFGVLLAQDSLAFAKAQRAAVAEQLAAAKERFDSGRARVTDVAEAQANFDALAAAEIAAESDLAVSRARFFALTGRDGEDPEPICRAGRPRPRGGRAGMAGSRARRAAWKSAFAIAELVSPTRTSTARVSPDACPSTSSRSRRLAPGRRAFAARLSRSFRSDVGGLAIQHAGLRRRRVWSRAIARRSRSVTRRGSSSKATRREVEVTCARPIRRSPPARCVSPRSSRVSLRRRRRSKPASSAAKSAIARTSTCCRCSSRSTT